MVEIKKGLRYHQDLVSLSEIDELKSVHEDDNYFYIGAGLTHNEIISLDIINKKLPSLSEALSNIGSEQVRNKGTIGGNLCTGASCCDSAPVLISLKSKVEIRNADEIKTVFLKDFFISNKKTILKKGEIMTRVIIPKPEHNTGVHYEKFGLREAVSIAVVSAAVMVRIIDNICTEACIVIGAVAPTPVISRSSTEILTGKNISELYKSSPLLEQIGEAAANDSIPIDDIRGSAHYRRDILKVITNRAVLKALENALGR